MTKSIDEWAAAKCGFDISHGEYFDIKDPRCREKFRNWWLNNDTNNAVLFDTDGVTYFKFYAWGQGDPKTRDTEEECITAIYETRD